MKFLAHIHTILLICGMALVSYGAFIVNSALGFVVMGGLMVLLAFIINYSRGG